MTKEKETFIALFKDFEYRYEPRKVFDDFLTMTVASLAYNPKTNLSYDEDLYLETIALYKDDKLRFHFPKMLGHLLLEMDERAGSSEGNDVIGEFFDEKFGRKSKGQHFTPWHICKFMASCTSANLENFPENERTLNILDPCCGSGRMLLASGRENGMHHNYFGIDIDHTCVKMTVLNLFFNGLFDAEVMWADALMPDDFRMSYQLSFLPIGVFRISEKEKSSLWNMHSESFKKNRQPDFENAPILSSKLVGKIHKEQGGSQLVLL